MNTKATALAVTLCAVDYFGCNAGFDAQKSAGCKAINLVDRLRDSGWSPQKASNELKLGSACTNWPEVEHELTLMYLWAAQVGYSAMKEVRHA